MVSVCSKKFRGSRFNISYISLNVFDACSGKVSKFSRSHIRVENWLLICIATICKIGLLVNFCCHQPDISDSFVIN